MTLRKFEVGKIYSAQALYGGTLSIEILGRADSEITYRYTEECSDDRSEMVAGIVRQTAYDPVTLEPTGEIESIEAWEYQAYPWGESDKGYYFARPVHGYRAGKLLASAKWL